MHKPIIDYYIEYQHPDSAKVWQRTYDYYGSLAAAQSRINQFKSMDYMRDCHTRIVQRTQTFELIPNPVPAEAL